MKTKILLLLLITAMLMSMCIFDGSAKEVESLAEIAAYSKLEPVGAWDDQRTFDKLAETGASSLPSSYSSKDLGYTTPVRQQSANICWAYSSLASLETLLLKSGESVEHFSPQHMNIWGTTNADGTGWQREDLVNDGGYSFIPMGYFTSWGGPLLDKELPENSGTTEYNNANSLYSVDYGVTGIRYLSPETPIDTIKSYIINYGAVVTNFSADTVNYMNANSEAFYCDDPTIKTSNLYGHSVSIVGWDDNYKKENFSTSHSKATPKNDGAWLIKNSWGTYINTSGGYFWISYEDAWLFNSIFGPSFVITDYIDIDNSKHIYQNEIYGATTQFSYLTSQSYRPSAEITYVNVYDFSEEYSTLDRVLFETTSFDADYTVYYIPVFGGKPTQEKGLWQELGEGTVDYTGYISVDTNDFTLPEGKGAIGVSIDNTRTYSENKDAPGYNYISNSIGVTEWLGYGGGYYFKNQGNYGDSFLIYNDNLGTVTMDVMDFYMKHFEDTMGCTFVIKAITENPNYAPNPDYSEPTAPDPTEVTSPSDNQFSLSLTLEYIGNDILTVIAETTGGSDKFEYSFKLNGEVFRDYSPTNYASITLSEDGDYNLQVSAREQGSTKVIISQSTVKVLNGKIQSGDQNLEVTDVVTEPTEFTTQPTETSQIPTETTKTAESETTADITTDSTTSTLNNAKAYLIGDVDFSGEISIKDATLIRKYLAKMADFDIITLTVADVDTSGKCNISDATNIQKFIALIDTNTNVGKTVMIQY